MTNAATLTEKSCFLLANARLLILQSQARIDAWKLLKRHAEEYRRSSRELLAKKGATDEIRDSEAIARRARSA